MSLRSAAVGRFLPRGGPYDLGLTVGRDKTGRGVLRVLAGGPEAIVARFFAEGRAVGIEILATAAVSAARVEEAMERARGIAALDDDPRGFAELVAGNPLLSRWHRRFAGVRLSKSPSVFEVVASAIFGQLVTYEEARAARGRMVRRYGAKVEGTELCAFPTPEVVAAIAPHELRAMGLGLRRAATLREVARRAAALERLRERPADEAIAAVQSIRGVGPWTANKLAIGALGWPDAVLVGDAVAPFVITMAMTGKAGGDAEMLACLEPYRPHRARVHQLFDLAEVLDHHVPGVPKRPMPTVDWHRKRPWES